MILAHALKICIKIESSSCYIKIFC